MPNNKAGYKKLRRKNQDRHDNRATVPGPHGSICPACLEHFTTEEMYRKHYREKHQTSSNSSTIQTERT